MRISFAFLALGLALPACGGSDGRYRIELLRRNDDNTYVPATTGEDLEVRHGFQGYWFLSFKARLTGTLPAAFDLDTMLSITGMPDFPESQTAIPADPKDPHLTKAFYVYMNHIDPIADVIGTTARVTFTPRDGAADPVALEGKLTNNPNCIEQFDLTLKCGM